MSKITITVVVELEAVRLLDAAQIPLGAICTELRVNREDLIPLLAEPTRMRVLYRIRLARLLREQACRVPGDAVPAGAGLCGEHWAHIIADGLQNGALEAFDRETDRVITMAMLTEPGNVHKRFYEHLAREIDE